MVKLVFKLGTEKKTDLKDKFHEKYALNPFHDLGCHKEHFL